MQTWEVTPVIAGVQTVWKHAPPPDLGGALLQHTWMGRSGFRPNVDGSFLVVKGLGPGPGSEWMRAHIDRNARRSHDGAGGCLRLDTGTPFALLVPFGRVDGEWRVHTARPEGMSRFRLCLLEAEVAHLYLRLSVPVSAPLSVSRVRYPTPWSEGSAASLARFLAERMPGAIRSHLSLPRSAASLPVVVGRQVYADLDGGVLARRLQSPFRVANLQQALIEEHRDDLDALVRHMAGVLRVEDAREVETAFLARLARTAGILFCEGVLHGQLHIHHQDITLAGELADLDCTTLLRSRPACVEDVPFGPSVIGLGYEQHRSRLEQLEAEFGVRLVNDADIRYEARFLGSRASDGWRRMQIATALLRQLFDLCNQALLAVDRIRRLQGGPVGPGQLSRLQALFARKAAEEIRQRGGGALLLWCLDNGWERLMDADLCPLDKRTLYGWASPGVPLDFVNTPGDEARARSVRAEVEAFFTTLVDQIGDGVRRA